jgi:hypothetical protein
MALSTYQPGETARCSGQYQELNIFGAPTGRIALMAEGEKLPTSPRGSSWRPLHERSGPELRAEANKYRRMAETATTLPVAASLRKIADRIDALADRKERESGGD